MKIKKAKLKIILVNENIERYNKQAFFGVSPKEPEIYSIWSDYNDAIAILKEHNHELYDELNEVHLPDPDVATSFSLMDVGEPVYHSKHFSTIANEVRKALKLIELEEEPNQPLKKTVPDTISIKASKGSNVSVQIGDNNQALQNVERINATLKEIENLGIENDDLIQLKQILSKEVDKSETKAGIGKRVMDWSGKMAGKLIEKGLSGNIPVLIEKASSLIDLI
jgi:hypothetical protein